MVKVMDEFDKLHDKFELLIRSANRGDRRALKMAGRAIAEMKAQIAIQYFNRSGPRVLRKSYEWDFWMDRQTRRAKVWN
jgi:hypothetical protein